VVCFEDAAGGSLLILEVSFDAGGDLFGGEAGEVAKRTGCEIDMQFVHMNKAELSPRSHGGTEREVRANPGLAIHEVCLGLCSYEHCQSRIRANGFQGGEESSKEPFV